MQIDPIDTDSQFFDALKAANVSALEQLLTDDFILIDVMSGSENTKTAFLAVVKSGQVKFESIEASENRTRIHGTTAIVTGRTEMKGRFADSPFTAQSRYTHVYILHQGTWRMVTAQGTPISTPPGP